MALKKYFEIDESCYLFGKQDSPEEKIRQWALFELLSNYGINIGNIRVETPVKVGSKTYRADIVIYRDNFPFALIECKEPSFSDTDKAIQQAISYANFLKTEYIVVTNGNFWIVKRRARTDWLPISDIPKKTDTNPSEVISNWLWFIEQVKPLLFWIHRQVPEKYAHKYLDRMQYFFAATKHFNDGDTRLEFGIDLLLRVVAGSNDVSDFRSKIEEYHETTLRVATEQFHGYFNKIGYKSELDEIKFIDLLGFRELLATLLKSFDDYVIKNIDASNSDMSLVKLIFSLLLYFQKILKGSRNEPFLQYEDIPPNVVNEFCNYVGQIFISRLGLSLPSPLDEDAIEQLRIITSNEWTNENGAMP